MTTSKIAFDLNLAIKISADEFNAATSLGYPRNLAVRSSIDALDDFLKISGEPERPTVMTRFRPMSRCSLASERQNG